MGSDLRTPRLQSWEYVSIYNFEHLSENDLISLVLDRKQQPMVRGSAIWHLWDKDILFYVFLKGHDKDGGKDAPHIADVVLQSMEVLL